MRRSLVISLVAAVVAALCMGLTTASAAPSAGRDPDRLDATAPVVQAGEIATIAQQGIEVSGQRQVGGVASSSTWSSTRPRPTGFGAEEST